MAQRYPESPLAVPGSASGLPVTPWAFATTANLVPKGPGRLFFGAGTTRLARAQALWASPPANMTNLKNAWNSSTTGLGYAFRYLMSCPSGQSTGGTLSLATSAYNAATTTPESTFSKETTKDAMFAQHAAFVYSWLYNILPSVASNARSTLEGQLNNYLGTATTNLLGQMQGGDQLEGIQMAPASNGSSGLTNYIACSLALEGTSGLSNGNQGLQIRNVVQHEQLLVDEHAPEGSTWAYGHFTPWTLCCFIMYFVAYQQESQLANLVKWVGNLPQDGVRRINSSTDNWNATTCPQIGSFDSLPLNDLTQANGTIGGDEYELLPWCWEMVADCLNASSSVDAGVAKYCSNQLQNNNWNNSGSGTPSNTNNPWSIYPQGTDCTWSAFIFNNTGIAAQAPSMANYTTGKCFFQAGRSNVRGGWNTNVRGGDVNGWFWGNPSWQGTAHGSCQFAGHFTIWRGQDVLFDSAYNYEQSIGTSGAKWEIDGGSTSVGNYSMCRNGLLISPTTVVSGRPSGVTAAMLDRNGSLAQSTDSTKSMANYPWSAWLNIFAQPNSPSPGIISGGFIANQPISATSTSGFTDNGSECCTQSELMGTKGAAWATSQCTKHSRYFSYVRSGTDSTSGTFVIRDTLTPASNLSRIRWQAFLPLCGRNDPASAKPSAVGANTETIVQGVTAAGVLKQTATTWTIVRGNSQATLQFVSPIPTNVWLIGGVGYESFFDASISGTGGSNLDFNSNTSGQFRAATYPRLQGLWRICFDVPVTTTEIVVVITIDANGTTAPTYDSVSQVQTLAPLAFGQTGTGPPPPPSVGAFSDYVENVALDWILGIGTQTRPVNHAVGLSVGIPNDTSGSEIGVGSGYTRQTATFAPAEGDVLGQSVSNMGNALSFGPWSSTAVISGFQVWDTTAATAGNMLVYGTWSNPHTVTPGGTLLIESGSLIISLA